MSFHIFEEKKYFENRINNDSEVLLVEKVESDSLNAYIDLYIDDGFSILFHVF